MSRLTAKLGFLHRTLWQRDAKYRWAVLLGPPPVLGCAVAALAWAGVQHFTPHVTAGDDIPWAHWTRPITEEGQPFAETPIGPLPRRDASGHFVGFQSGWVGLIQPMTVDAALETRVTSTITARFALDQPTIPLARVLDAGSPTGLFLGTVRAFFPVQTPGLYAFSARFTRSSPQSADCLVWLGSTHHRMVRTLSVNTNGQTLLSFPPTEFQLPPGLFEVQVSLGCWRGDQMVGPGEVTVLVRRPGETTLTPINADEVIRPIPPVVNASPRP